MKSISLRDHSPLSAGKVSITTMHIRNTALIDKLSATIPIHISHWYKSSDNLLALLDDPSGCFTQTPRDYDWHHRELLYHFAMTIRLSSSVGTWSCFLQFAPRFTNAAFLRLEITPSKTPKNALHIIFSLLERLIPTFWIGWTNAKITRMDIAVDLLHLHISELLVFSDSAATEQIDDYWPNFYLGSKLSNNRVAVYDKCLEENRNRRGRKAMSNSGEQKTRVEFRFKDLGSISNIFIKPAGLDRFHIALNTEMLRYPHHRAWRTFLSNCKLHGVQTVLQSMKRRKRTEFRQMLKRRINPTFLNKDDIWQECQASLQAILPIPPTTKRLSRNSVRAHGQNYQKPY